MTQLNTILQSLAGGMSAQQGADVSLGGSAGGSPSQVQDLIKALTASNYQTDVATLTDGGALGVQSLDNAMKAIVQEQEHFVLFKKLATTNATNIVDEYVRKTGVGGHLGGSVISQMGVVQPATGEYSREIGLVKFLATLRQVGYVGNLVNNIASMTAEEEINGGLQLLTDAEFMLFEGNADACPVQFDGIFKQINDAVTAGDISADHVIDMQATPLKSVEPLTKIGAAVAKYGNWGYSTDLLLPLDVQVDLNNELDPAFRWSQTPSASPLTIGTHVEGIRLQNGVLRTSMDTFIPYDDFPSSKPFEVTWSATAAANVAIKPASLTVDAGTSDATSMFGASHAGNYFYAVTGISGEGRGQSAITAATVTAVAAGKKAVLTITKSSGGAETGYAIYRSKLGATSAVAADMRLVTIVAKDGTTTTYTDVNRDIPGTVRVPILNMRPGSDAIGWRQFNPMTKIPLPFGIGGMMVHSWFQCLMGYLRITKPAHHGIIKNILPSNATWRPFG